MSERKILLVGWDGADWRVARPLLEAGELPQLALALKHGASGPVASLPPYLSPMLWNSMATGKRPHRHGILGFSQVNPVTGKVQPVSSHLRRCPAFWNILSARHIPNHVVGWFASHPAEEINGVCVSESFVRPPKDAGEEWPISKKSVFPEAWSERLHEVRVRPNEVDPQLLQLFLPSLDEIDFRRDSRCEEILYRLAELYTAHNAAVTLLSSGEPWRCLAVYYHFVDWICHEFMQFRPPVQPGVSSRQVRFYGAVVDAAYRVQDFLLNDLLSHAGPDVTLLLTSDHGFQSDHLRPAKTPDVTAGVADWHRPHGMIVIAGPGIKAGETIEGASILDVGPTLLHLLDLPVGDDMDGRALFEVETEPRRPHSIPSWDKAIPGWPRDPVQKLSESDEAEDADLLKQFVDLGYLEMPSNPHEDLAEMTERENGFNLGISLLDAHLPYEALPHLWFAHASAPETPHYAFHLARALADLRLADEAMEVLDVVRDFGENLPAGKRLRAQIAFKLGDLKATAQHLAVAGDAPIADASSHNQHGLLALQEGRFEEAENCFRSALASDSDDAIASLGLARSLLRRKRWKEAIEAARKALSLKRELPLAHLTLAEAFEGEGDTETAAASYAEALRLEPELANSRDGLLRLHPGASPKTQDLVLTHLARARGTQTPARVAPAQARATLRQLKKTHQSKLKQQRASVAPAEEYRFPSPRGVATSGKRFLIVSGLPRSGTSMLMQMLARAGLEPMTDQVREADSDNPLGYFEWEAIKRLVENPGIIEQAGTRPVKVISALLAHLPREHNYQIIFLRRPVEEIARSQRVMLDRSGKAGAGEDIQGVASNLQRHEEAVLQQLRSRQEVELLEIPYHQAIDNSEQAAARIQAFAGADRFPRPEQMAQAVNPALYRQRLTK